MPHFMSKPFQPVSILASLQYTQGMCCFYRTHRSNYRNISCLLCCFPVQNSTWFLTCFFHSLQFAVLYEARSNTGIDRMKIINAVAKSIPQPHKVDLSNPDKTIIVQIAKVNALIQLDCYQIPSIMFCGSALSTKPEYLSYNSH